MNIKFITFLLAGLLFFNTAQFSFSETLNDALVEAYRNNISLQKARHATEEAIQNVRLAESGFFPTVSAVGSINYQKNKEMQYYTKTNALQIVIDQNIFSGFKTVNSVKAAKARALAQLQNLRNEEQNQLNNAAAAYVNVYASREIVALRHSDLLALKEQVRTAKARLTVGEGTKTDYAQAQASYSRAVAEYSESISQNTQAEAVYRQIIGSDPKILSRPEICRDIPKSLDESLNIAFARHPAILAASYNFKASQANLEAAKSDFYPKIDFSVGAGYQKSTYQGQVIRGGNDGRATTFGLKMALPIYEGGARVSQYNIANQQLSEAQLEVALYRENVRAALVSAWAKLKSSRTSVMGYLESVRAAKIALAGRVAEHDVGQATELDVLTTRSQLITMQVALINAKRELIVASYNLKAAIGALTAAQLDLIKHKDIVTAREISAKIIPLRKAEIYKLVPNYNE